VQSAAKTVADYLAELPDDRRAAIDTLRATIRKAARLRFMSIDELPLDASADLLADAVAQHRAKR
jgi:hypothetical protein